MKTLLSIIVVAVGGMYGLDKLGPAGQNKVEYTIKQNSVWRAPTGESVVKVCRARNADRVYVLAARYPAYKGEGWQFRRIFKTDGISIAVDDQNKHKWTLSDYDSKRVARNNTNLSIKPEECTLTGRVIRGTEVIRGLSCTKFRWDTVMIMQERQRADYPSVSWDVDTWPEGGCVTLGSFQRIEDKFNPQASSTQTTTTEELTFGTPDPKLFEVPQDYIESHLYPLPVELQKRFLLD